MKTQTLRFWAVPVCLAGAVLLVMGFTASDPGLTWDESYYTAFAGRYGQWVRAAMGMGPGAGAAFAPHSMLYEKPFSKEVLRSYWGLDPVRPGEAALGQKHPPLGKMVSAFFMAVYGSHGLDYTAARLGSALLFAGLCLAMYLLVRRLYDAPAAVFSVLALAAMPRFVAHMRLATLEPCLALFSTLTILLFPLACKDRRWVFACAAAFGLALLSKINAVLIPFVVAPWGLLFLRRKAVPALAFMAAAGPLIFVLGWPALWTDTINGLTLYFRDKFIRAPIPCFYFGHWHKETFAPWHYALVMPLITTPALVLAAACAGLARCRRAWGAEPETARLDLLMALAVA
ncbi:MAG TPA: glycosyltransferase family 39 protein, partial [Candidatus Brocadiia bacterium]|nr:glycosyltransferase family 39 protein [Candidatus Brocadiia bacterium]